MKAPPKIFRRTFRGFEPENETAREAMFRIKIGAAVALDWRRPRSLPWHRKYWALVQIVSQNTSYSPEEVHCLFKLRAGLVKEIRERNGHVWRVPDSTSFDKMDADGWSEYWNRVVDYVTAELLPGVTKDTLARELADLVGVEPATPMMAAQ